MFQRIVITLVKLSLLLFLVAWVTGCQPPTPSPPFTKLGVNFWNDVMDDGGSEEQLFVPGHAAHPFWGKA
jgi:hypothetical protein